MASLAGLPYFIQYQGELQQQALARQKAQQDMLQFQQAQQDRQHAQAAQAAAGNALPGLLAGSQVAAQPQLPPPPMPPAPGQASQPATPQGASTPLPGMGPAPGGALKPPLPPGGVGGQIQPFRPMPTTPPQASAPQGAIPAPPAQAAATPSIPGRGLSLDNAIKALKDQGLSGGDLFAGLQQLMPVLDNQAKMQAAAAQQQFTRELQLAQLQERYDALKQRSEDQAANREQRALASQESNALRAEMIGIRKQQVSLSNGEDAKFTPDDLSFLAQQARAGDTSVYQNLGRGVQGAKNIIALRREVMRQAKEAGETGADIAAANAGFQGEKAAARTGATRAANIGMAVTEAKNTFPLVRQASAALPRTEFVPVNRALQAAQTNAGDPRVIALGTAINTSINAYARAISPTGTPTVADKEHARELLSTANTQDQLEAVLGIMEKEMAAAQKAPTEVMDRQKARISGRGEPTAPGTGGPAVGTVESGYRFKGGDPASPSSWERVQ